MPYSKDIAERIEALVNTWPNFNHKKMFGGVCYLLSGNMFCGVYKDYLILRLGKEEARDALRLDTVRPFDITGKPMKGWVMVKAEGFADRQGLQAWLNKARRFVQTLPPK